DGSPANDEFSAKGFEYLTGLPAGEDEIDVTVTAQTRCLAGKAYVAVRAVNDDDVPLTITLESPYGTKTIENVAAGKNAYQSFNARLGAIDAGQASVTATDAEGRTVTVTSDYDALTCG